MEIAVLALLLLTAREQKVHDARRSGVVDLDVRHDRFVRSLALIKGKIPPDFFLVDVQRKLGCRNDGDRAKVDQPTLTGRQHARDAVEHEQEFCCESKHMHDCRVV